MTVTVKSIEPGSERIRCEGKIMNTDASGLTYERRCIKRARYIVTAPDVSASRALCGECMGRARDGAGAGE